MRISLRRCRPSASCRRGGKLRRWVAAAVGMGGASWRQTVAASSRRGGVVIVLSRICANFVGEKQNVMNGTVRDIVIVTSTRADWGLLSPVAKSLQRRENVRVSIIATNMHLDESRGMTVNEIRDDGFEPVALVPMAYASDSEVDTAVAMGEHLADMSRTLGRLRPDLLLILGDRFEMLAVASAATMLHIPIAHISGGEITMGAIDDNIRHAISKLSAIHFATTEQHRRRLVAMGEQPDRVLNTGALGVWNMLHAPIMRREELEASIGFNIDRTTLLVTYHPATNDAESPALRFGALLEALDRHKDCKVIITYPNNDPNSAEIIAMIKAYQARRGAEVLAAPSLGALRYRSALHYVSAVVGNSSSGVVEVPSAGVPVVNIGMRQQGRTASEAVIHCGDDTDAIDAAITMALTPEAKTRARLTPNPYQHDDTAEMIADYLAECDIATLLPKRFYDI